MAGFAFLSADNVQRIHAREIDRHGGDHGTRDRSLLDSAVAMPQQTFGGEYLHAGLPEMAAAYMFHILSNHPFVDGNKRAGTMAALVFLRANGVLDEELPPEEALEEAAFAVARGEMDKEALTRWWRRQLDTSSGP